jgi:hypothetical protein
VVWQKVGDRLEVAVEADGSSTADVAEHPLMHLCPKLAHLTR